MEVYWSRTILHELEQQIQETSTDVLIDFFFKKKKKNIMRVCAFHGAEVCVQHAALMVTSDIKRQCMGCNMVQE